MIAKILESGGMLTGGIVRDWLIRGETFNDVDFYFDQEPEWILEWGSKNKRLFREVDCVTYHCQRIVPGTSTQDLTCNLFSFSLKRGLFARPSPYDFDYNYGFAMLLQKEFGVLDLRDANIRFKMIGRGWKEIYMPKKRREVYAPESGIWDAYSDLARQRLNLILT